MAKFIGSLVLISLAALAGKVCWAQQITGKIRPEKQVYLVGEPVFVVLDIANNESRPLWISESCRWLDTRFEANTAPQPRREVSLFGCGGGTAGSCGSGVAQILPGTHYQKRYLLDGAFLLNSPGVYPIRAWHKVVVYARGTGFRVIASQELISDFRLKLIEPTGNELGSAYEPVLRDLDNKDGFKRSLALAAVVQHPPLFLEDVILSLADHPQTAADSIPGLKWLATPRAKAKLADLSGSGSPEVIRQMSIPALAALGDPAYCSTMLDFFQKSSQYSRFIALRAAGYLCGEKVLPLLRSLLPAADGTSRFEIAYALGNSHIREAVPVLISLLLDTDSDVRRAAADSLASLTHRSGSRSGVDDEEVARRVQKDWDNWWKSEGASAQIYRVDDCREASPLG
jgi:hypothetical protein